VPLGKNSVAERDIGFGILLTASIAVLLDAVRRNGPRIITNIVVKRIRIIGINTEMFYESITASGTPARNVRAVVPIPSPTRGGI
jgi:hypothetical protein